MEAEGESNFPFFDGVVEDTDSRFVVAWEEAIVDTTDKLGLAVVFVEIAEITLHVDTQLFAAAKMVLDEDDISSFGEVSTRTILIVGPAGKQVDQ